MECIIFTHIFINTLRYFETFYKNINLTMRSQLDNADRKGMNNTNNPPTQGSSFLLIFLLPLKLLQELQHTFQFPNNKQLDTYHNQPYVSSFVIQYSNYILLQHNNPDNNLLECYTFYVSVYAFLLPLG